MRHERQVELLSRLKGRDPLESWPLDKATYRNPARNYVDPARFEQERQRLFKRRALMLGLSSEIARPGARMTAEAGGVPIVVVRQRDGSLKGMVNACRHRAAPVVATGEDALPRLSCPYHGWAYDLDGSLIARPYAEEAFSDAPKADCGLKPIPVAEKYGIVFARLQGEPIDVDAELHGAQEELGPYGLENYVLVEEREQICDFNWKLILDTFTESYHIRALHKNSIAASYMPELSIADAFGPHPRMIGLLKTVMGEVEKPDTADWNFLPHTTAQLIFMPSGLITYQRDHVELWRCEPLAVDKTRLRTTLYAPTAPETDKARAYWKKNMDLLFNVTGQEDFPTMRQIHLSMAAGAIDELIYGRNEPCLIHLHRSINELIDNP